MLQVFIEQAELKKELAKLHILIEQAKLNMFLKKTKMLSLWFHAGMKTAITAEKMNRLH